MTLFYKKVKASKSEKVSEILPFENQTVLDSMVHCILMGVEEH
jgi:hypothetical protein